MREGGDDSTTPRRRVVGAPLECLRRAVAPAVAAGSCAMSVKARQLLDGVVRGFLVEKGTPGFTQQEMRGKYSLRASDTSELVLHDVAVPRRAMLPGVKGLPNLGGRATTKTASPRSRFKQRKGRRR